MCKLIYETEIVYPVQLKYGDLVFIGDEVCRYQSRANLMSYRGDVSTNSGNEEEYDSVMIGGFLFENAWNGIYTVLSSDDKVERITNIKKDY